MDPVREGTRPIYCLVKIPINDTKATFHRACLGRPQRGDVEVLEAASGGPPGAAQRRGVRGHRLRGRRPQRGGLCRQGLDRPAQRSTSARLSHGGAAPADLLGSVSWQRTRPLLAAHCGPYTADEIAAPADTSSQSPALGEAARIMSC